MDANHGERRVKRCEPLASSAADRHLMLLWQMANKQNYDASTETTRECLCVDKCRRGLVATVNEASACYILYESNPRCLDLPGCPARLN